MAYGTLVDADAYHLARNNSEWAAASETARNGALQRASDYVDNKYRSRFPGVKTGGRAQAAEWPRTGALDVAGATIPTDEIPVEIEYATYELALLIVKGINPNPVAQGGAVKRKKVKAGPVETETEYVDGVDSYDSFSIVDGILSSLLETNGVAQIELLRA